MPRAARLFTASEAGWLDGTSTKGVWVRSCAWAAPPRYASPTRTTQSQHATLGLFIGSLPLDRFDATGQPLICPQEIEVAALVGLQDVLQIQPAVAAAVSALRGLPRAA